MISIKGYRGELNKEQLLLAVAYQRSAHVGIAPAIRNAAIDLLRDGIVSRRGIRVDGRSQTYRSWLRSRARAFLVTLILDDPERYGLVKIDPEEIDSAVSTSQLADFCGVDVSRVRALARGAPQNGLPVPEWPLGRTLHGRGWRFPKEIAKEYAERLLE